MFILLALFSFMLFVVVELVRQKLAARRQGEFGNAESVRVVRPSL